jgi:HK97 family phage major capsid protein
MKKYLEKMKQNSMMGRKMRFRFSCMAFAFLAMAVVCALSFVGDPAVGLVTLAGFGLMPFIDTKDMSEDDKKVWGKIDEALGKATDAYLKENIKIEDFKQTVIDAIKGMDEFKQKDITGLLEKKTFDEKIKEFEEELVKVKGLMEKGENGKPKFKSIEQQIEEQLKDFILDEKGRKVVDLKSACQKSPGSKKTIELVLDHKAITSTGVAPHLGLSIDPNIDVEPRAETFIRKYSNVTRINTRSLVIAEFVPGLGDADWVPEGGLKPAMNATLQERTITVGKVALTVKLTEETLVDLPQLVSEVKTELIYRIGFAEEHGILEGTGTGGEIAGVLPTVPGYVLTGLVVEVPNKFDAIVACYTQIVSTSKSAYRPNLVFMNPIDYADMQLTKDVNGQYLRPFRSGDELIQGLKVETSTAVTQGSLFIGDFNYLNIRDYIMFSITFGWENDDFTKNLVTMIGEKRLMAYIKRQYHTAFVYDTFANVITAISPEPPTAPQD